MSDLSPSALLGVGLLTLPGSALMPLFLLPVTGVPLPTEANLGASRGDADRAWQRTTNAFFPGPARPAPQGTNR